MVVIREISNGSPVSIGASDSYQSYPLKPAACHYAFFSFCTTLGISRTRSRRRLPYVIFPRRCDFCITCQSSWCCSSSSRRRESARLWNKRGFTVCIRLLRIFDTVSSSFLFLSFSKNDYYLICIVFNECHLICILFNEYYLICKMHII